MHELSIAMSIVEIAEEESARRGGLQVTAVHLRLGLLAGVVRDALLSSYELASAGTRVAGSTLVVEEVPGVVYCSACKVPRAARAPDSFCCPECGAIASKIVGGKELEVVSLEISE